MGGSVPGSTGERCACGVAEASTPSRNGVLVGLEINQIPSTGELPNSCAIYAQSKYGGARIDTWPRTAVRCWP